MAEDDLMISSARELWSDSTLSLANLAFCRSNFLQNYDTDDRARIPIKLLKLIQ
jgi:hypothetical protein